jgi:hypothetical protein
MPKRTSQSEDEKLAKKIGAEGCRMVRQLVPEFAEAVSRAREEHLCVELSIAGLDMAPEILYLCIWYASDQGVPVTFVPWVRHIATRASGSQKRHSCH